MHTYAMTINGESAPTEASFEVVNPATGSVFDGVGGAPFAAASSTAGEQRRGASADELGQHLHGVAVVGTEDHRVHR